MPKGPGFIWRDISYGGSGAVTVTEIVYDRKTKTNKVITVRKVCGSCGGSGGRHI